MAGGGGGGGQGEPSVGELWASLTAEVERLTKDRPRGLNFSEDFAVDRACAAISKLERNCGGASGSPSSAIGGAGSAMSQALRAELAVEEQKLGAQQAQLDEERGRIEQARALKEQLTRELEREESGRREVGEEQAKLWRDASLKTHACSAALRSKEQERLQLENLASSAARPEAFLEAFDGLLQKMKAELEDAKEESSTARRQLLQLRSQPAASPTSDYEGASAEVGAASAAAAALEGAPSSRDELLRIASRASEKAKSLQVAAAMAGMPTVGGSPGASPAENGGFASTEGASLGEGVSERTSVLGEAQRVLERVEAIGSGQIPAPS